MLHTGVDASIYTISPHFSGSEYVDGDRCDGAGNDLPWCLEVDWTESNGQPRCTKPGPGDDGRTVWACRVEYDFKVHMKITRGSDDVALMGVGKLT